jgi:hypothetical protein
MCGNLEECRTVSIGDCLREGMDRNLIISQDALLMIEMEKEIDVDFYLRESDAFVTKIEQDLLDEQD